MSNVEIEMPKINTSSSHFLRAQKSDPSLYHLWECANTNTGSYCVIGNLLYKHTPHNVNSSHDYLLVLPYEYSQKVIQMAHNSGHLGSQKTRETISSLFYFPKMKQKVRQHVRCCHKCISSPLQKGDKQPLRGTQATNYWERGKLNQQ